MSRDKALEGMLGEELSALGSISVRGMFGGAAVHCDGIVFALLADGALYLKADESTVGTFKAEGLGPFTYQGKSGPVRLSYWRAPSRLNDDPGELRDWARRALAVARREVK